jgi:pimeloyl-ACP methyl ester carboxylesterase
MIDAVRRLSLACLAVLTLGASQATRQGEPTPGTSMFVVLVGGVRVGTERVSLTRSPGGWLISATSQLVSPFSLVTNKFEMTYGLDWQPLELVVEALVDGRPMSMRTTFGLTTANTDLVQDGQRASGIEQVSPRTVVLPNNFFAAYEALAVKLGNSTVGDRFPVFLAPDTEVSATVDRVTARSIVTQAASMDIRHFDVTYSTPAGPLAVEVWTDAANRLARLVIPAAGLSVVRDDLASVMAREATVRNPTDEDVFIPASGFSLAATITKPTVATEKAPIVVLVPAAGPENRDYSLYGIPIFGRLAGALADAGYFVVRYDKRGVGQSGGRAESAAIDQYVDDVRRVISWARKRDDVDRDIAIVIGHDQGAVVALRTADREGRVRGVVLLSAAAEPGYQVALEQQQQRLSRSGESEGDKLTKVALQHRLLDAVVSGEGWDGVPVRLRRQADTPWFRSWLLFDPAEAINEIDEPILIIHGELDRELPVGHADRLEEFSRLRDEPDTHTRKVIVTGMNHMLVPATTGEVEEYQTLSPEALSPEAVAAVLDWLRTTIAARRR